MDQELIAYLDQRFGETNQQIAALRQETAQQVIALREEIDQRFGETNQQIAALRQETAQQVITLREEIDQRFGETNQQIAALREEIRHTHVEVEGLRGDVRLLAEGIGSVEEKMASFRRQVTGEIAGVRQLIQPAYSALDDRLQLLEAWRERKERDPLEVIRERFGLGKLAVPEG